MRKMLWPVAALFAISFSTAALAQEIDWQKVDEALGLLAPIHSRFTEGFHTSDLVAAANLLDELRSRR